MIQASSNHSDPDHIRASEWIERGGEDPSCVILGIPYSRLSISGARCDLLPYAVRKALASFSTFDGTADLSEMQVVDRGDLDIPGGNAEDVLAGIEEAVRSVGSPAVFLGGDNSITSAAVMGAIGEGAGVITLDAHHDLRNYARDGYTNGSPMRVLLDRGVKGTNIWQIGIAPFANAKTYSDFARSSGINVVTVEDARAIGPRACVAQALDALSGCEAVYVDFDIDVVDRALVPAAPAALPGGLHPKDLIQIARLCGSNPLVRCIDIVEVDPMRDVVDSTVRLAAMVLLSFLSGLRSRGPIVDG